jgi:hypothetical protein
MLDAEYEETMTPEAVIAAIRDFAVREGWNFRDDCQEPGGWIDPEELIRDLEKMWRKG